MTFDVAQIRAEFPSLEESIHFDHASISPISLRAADAMRDVADAYATLGYQQTWQDDAERVRSRIATLVGSTPGNIAFTQNTSTGLSIAANGLDWRPGDNVVLAEREFPSNFYPWLNLERRGVELRRVPAPGGHADLDGFAAAIDERTRVLAVSAVQFSNGHRYDLDAIGDLCRARGVLLVVDGTQSVGALTIDVARAGIDVLAVSAHKWMLGPAGIGFVHLSDRAMDRISPEIVGWLSVREPFAFRYELDLPPTADRYEAGTENIVGTLGLGAAVSLLLEHGPRAIEQRVLLITDEICEALRGRGYEILSPRKHAQRSGIVIFSHATFDPAELHARLAAAGVRCAPRGGGIRFSPHCYNDAADVERALAALP